MCVLGGDFACPAIFFRHGDAEYPEITELAEERDVEAFFPVKVIGLRRGPKNVRSSERHNIRSLGSL